MRVYPRNLVANLLKRFIAGVTVASLLTSVVATAPISTPKVEAAGANPIYWGAYQDAAPFYPTQIDQFESDAGKRESIVHWGEPWQMSGKYMAFQTPQFEAIRQRGSIPMIDWNSWNLGAPIQDPNFTLAKIYSGTYDAYITQWAQSAKAWGHPFFLRFDHEMNGWWQFPWSVQLNGNQPADFIKAWRHVHDIFTRVGATNVTWVWCVNVVSANPATTPLSQIYPGDDYVDWTSFDGYNKADSASSWLSASQIYGLNPWSRMNTYQQLVDLAPTKPIMIGETATTLTGGDPGAWARDMLQTVQTQFPQIKAVVWFNWGETWPIESSTSLQAGFKQGISSSYYATNTFTDLPAGPIQPIGGPIGGAPAPAPVTSTPAPVTSTPVPVTSTPTPVASTPQPVTDVAVTAPASSASQIRVQVGGGSYVSPDGRAWEADTAYSGGAVASSTGSVANTTDPALYQDVRFGKNFAYNFSVPNGTYTVVLKFAEMYWGSAGQRVFNVTSGGKAVLSNFDILAQPGAAPKTAVDKRFTTTVTSGVLNIAFSTVTDNAQINAIEIIPGTPVRINAGGGAATGSDGGTWQADANYAGGATFAPTTSVSKTLDQGVYQSLRYGTNFGYNVAVPNGTYRVALKFAERYWTSAGMRVFNVAINNQSVLNNFDILAQPGSAPNAAVDKTFVVTVTDGQMRINFAGVKDNAQINAIEILPGQ